MNIGQAAKATGLTDKALRYYEQIDLVKPGKRPDNGYRDYNEHHVEELRFIASARKTGFSIDECRSLLALFRDDHRHSKHVKQFVEDKLQQVEAQIGELLKMQATLKNLADQCRGDEGPECGIIDTLSHPKS